MRVDIVGVGTTLVLCKFIHHINEVANGHSTSTVRNLYIVGENQLHVGQTLGAADIRRSKSYAVVEINSDNSKGMVYYSGDPITQSIIEGATDLEHPTGKASRLYTGNDIQGAHATDANYVAFIWTVGTGPFEIESIKSSIICFFVLSMWPGYQLIFVFSFIKL